MFTIYKKDKELAWTKDKWLVVNGCLMTDRFKEAASDYKIKEYSQYDQVLGSDIIERHLDGYVTEFHKTNEFTEIKLYTYQINGVKARIYRSKCGQERYVAETYARRIKDKVLLSQAGSLTAMVSKDYTLLVMPMRKGV